MLSQLPGATLDERLVELAVEHVVELAFPDPGAAIAAVSRFPVNLGQPRSTSVNSISSVNSVNGGRA